MNKNSNLAIDYRMNEENDVRTVRNISHKRSAAVSKKNKALSFAGVAVVIALLAAVIMGRVEISELYTQRAELESQLTQIQDENISLEAEFTQKTGMTKVEEYAEDKLGLHKLDKSQIEYVEVESDGKAQVIKTDDSNVFVKIKRWFNSALEYIGL